MSPGLYDREHLRPSRPDDPESAIDRSELRTLPLTPQDRELLPEREVLGDEARPRSEGGAERADDRHEELEHAQTFVGRPGLSAANWIHCWSRVAPEARALQVRFAT
jgi:hypothetical protein